MNEPKTIYQQCTDEMNELVQKREHECRSLLEGTTPPEGLELLEGLPPMEFRPVLVKVKSPVSEGCLGPAVCLTATANLASREDRVRIAMLAEAVSRTPGWILETSADTDYVG